MKTASDSHFRLFSVHERMCAVVLLVVEEEATMLMCTLWVLVGIAVVRAARKVVSGRVSFMVAWLVRGVLWRWLVVRGLEVTGGW
jgi:hypothetical protein